LKDDLCGCSLVWLGHKSNVDLNDFKRFLKIDLALSRLTITAHVSKMNNFFSHVKKPIDSITKDDVRSYLEVIREKYQSNTYCCFIKALRRFFRDYLNKPELCSFKFPTIPFKPKMIEFDKTDLVRFYEAIDHNVVKMMFLGYCVSGLRRNDLMYLMKSELNRDNRMIIKNNDSLTKHKWITFYNDELAINLDNYLDSRIDSNPRVFVAAEYRTFEKYWDIAQDKAKLSITPKDLRDFFCVEMTNLGVPDRYIDAYCGRIPKSILGRNYTDYSPKTLKAIYEKAGLKILS